MKQPILLITCLILHVTLSNTCFAQEVVESYPYEFRIFKEGKPLSSYKANVKAFYYSFDKNAYEELTDTCDEKDKYCYHISVKGHLNILLKIYAGKDSMIVYTPTSLDSLFFKPGVYNYSYDHYYIQSIIPFDPAVRIEPANSWFKTYPTKSSDLIPAYNRNIESLNIFDPDSLLTESILPSQKHAVLEFKPEEYEELQKEEDTCSKIIDIDGKPLFMVKQCNVKFFDNWDMTMKYLKITNPSFYRLGEKRLLVFQHFFLYSDTKNIWYYYPKSDFYSLEQQQSPKYHRDSLFGSWVRGFYWLEGRGLLGYFVNTRLFIINTKKY